MLKKFNVLALIVLLIVQTMIAPIAATAQATKSTETPVLKDGVFVDGQEELEEIEGELSSTRTVEFEWTLNEEVEIGESYTANVPGDSTIEQEQSGELIFEEEQIGTFSATEAGIASIEFNEAIEDLLEPATGTFEIDVEVIVEGNEEQTLEEEVAEPEATESEENENSSEPEEQPEETPAKEDNEGETTPVEGKEVEETVEGKEENAEPEVNQTEESELDPKEETEQVRSKAIQKDLKAANEKTGFELEIDKVTDFEGNEYTGDKKLNPADEFSFNLAWNLENAHTYTNGDSIEFDLPKQVYIPEEMTDRELKDEYGDIIAHYTVTTDNKITLIFTDYVDRNSNVEGFIGIVAKLNPDAVEIVDGEVTIQPIGAGEPIVISTNPADNNKEVSKTGKPAKDYNADEINWTVTANGSGADLKDAKVIDALPEGLTYKEGSLKVTKYETNLLGEVVGEGEEVEITPEINGACKPW